ncbi:MAG: hypothetical protein M5T52_24135 [Ignavibacteriaceae bacterium]|nr:hypothetical protein [Ignavibacteriaceae bacterium]
MGRFLKIVNKTKSRFPGFGLDIEKNGEPDFYISKNGKTLFKKIEITEVLKPGRKRSLEYKNKSRDANEVSNIWSSFHERLNEKFKRDFGDDCWLIIYHNIRYTDITSVGFWHNMMTSLL